MLRKLRLYLLRKLAGREFALIVTQNGVFYSTEAEGLYWFNPTSSQWEVPHRREA